VLFECAEQLGWTLPHHIVVRSDRARFSRVRRPPRNSFARPARSGIAFPIHAAQPAGCAPVSDAVLDNWRPVEPVRRPQTLAKSLAIGRRGRRCSVQIIRDTRVAQPR